MTMPTGRVAVGYDGSEHGRRALFWAATEAVCRHGVLVVVSAADYRGVGLRGPVTLARAWAKAAADEAREMAAAGASLARAAVPHLLVDITSGVGAPVPLLVRASEDVDLLVLGAHGEGPEAAEMLGTIAEGVAGRARCPVVVVDGGEKCRPGPQRPVVVGVDGSAVGLMALEFAAELAQGAGARLRVVSAWGRPRAGDVPVASGEGGSPLSKAGARAAVDEAVARARMAHPGLTGETVTLGGEPTRVLTDQAIGAGMLVLGRRARPRPVAALGPALGSVGCAMVRTAPCPVAFVGPSFVVPAPQRNGRDRTGEQPALRGHR